jgi:hypothetical protein
MGVKENPLNEIFEERARYLVNLDEMILETMGEPTVVEKKFDAGPAYNSVTGEIDLIKNLKVVDQLFESKEFRTFIEITSPEQLSKRKMQPLSPRTFKDENLPALEPDAEEA